MAFWGLLFFANRHNILTLQVIGDSKVIMDWPKGDDVLHVITLE